MILGNVYESKYPKVKIFVTVISLFLIIVAAVWYIEIYRGTMDCNKFNKEEFLRKWSPLFFAFSLTNATVCIMLPKREET